MVAGTATVGITSTGTAALTAPDTVAAGTVAMEATATAALTAPAIVAGTASTVAVATLFPPQIVDAPPRRWKVDAERDWVADASARRLTVDDEP